MGVYEGRGQLTKAMKNLMLHWSEARSNWDDSVSKKFEEEHIVTLEQDLKMAVGAMDHMAVLLQQIHSDCD